MQLNDEKVIKRMKVELISKSEDRIEVQVFKEGHTLCAPLKDFIFEKVDAVDMAGYKIRHPLKPDPSIYVKIKDGSKQKPGEILIESTEDFLKTIKSFEDTFKKSLSGAKK